jgi:hypothetical protein
MKHLVIASRAALIFQEKTARAVRGLGFVAAFMLGMSACRDFWAKFKTIRRAVAVATER